ncbi:hypothetical protein HpHNI6_16750 [Helicobacter pylori]
MHFVAVKLGLNLILNFKEEGGNFRPYPYVGEVLEIQGIQKLSIIALCRIKFGYCYVR